MYSAPINLTFAVTSLCNLRCKHCLTLDRQQNHHDFSLSEIKSIIKEIAELKIFGVAIFGGEPFMRSDILDILSEISRSPISVSINSNGTLIDANLARELSRFRAGYTISLDGSTSAVVEKIRGKGVFEKTISAIEHLQGYKKPVLISTTVMGFNYHDLSAIARLGKELGVSGVRFNHLFYINNAECFLDQLTISANQALEVVSVMEELQKEYGSFISGSFLQLTQYLKEIKDGKKPEVFEPSLSIEVKACGAARNKCAIKPNGEVIPCELLWNTPAGNIREQSLRDIWHHSQVMKEFRETFYLTEKEIGDCMRCEYRFICYTGHRCNPYYYPGGVMSKRLFCLKPEKIKAS